MWIVYIHSANPCSFKCIHSRNIQTFSHSFMHPAIYSLLIYSFILVFSVLLSDQNINSFIHQINIVSFTYPLILFKMIPQSLIYWFIKAFIHSSIYLSSFSLFPNLFIHSCIHLFPFNIFLHSFVFNVLLKNNWFINVSISMSSICLLMETFIYSSIHSSLIARSFSPHLFIHRSVPSSNIYPLMETFIHASMYSFISFTCSSVHFIIYSFVHDIHPFIHGFTHLLMFS